MKINMSIGYSLGEDELRWVARLIRFKQCILSMDIPSRKFMLENCISFVENQSSKDDYHTILTDWFKTFSIITEDVDKDMRKSESKKPEFWERIHKALPSLVLRQVIVAVVGW